LSTKVEEGSKQMKVLCIEQHPLLLMTNSTFLFSKKLFLSPFTS